MTCDVELFVVICPEAVVVVALLMMVEFCGWPGDVTVPFDVVFFGEDWRAFFCSSSFSFCFSSSRCFLFSNNALASVSLLSLVMRSLR